MKNFRTILRRLATIPAILFCFVGLTIAISGNLGNLELAITLISSVSTLFCAIYTLKS